MSVLSRLEAALERLAEGGAERVFGGRLDLVAVGQELFNAAAAGARAEARGPRAPNAYGIRLALGDYGHFSHEVEAFQARYAASLWGRLREAGYALDTPPGVQIAPDEQVAAGSAGVAAAFVAARPTFTLSSADDPTVVYRLTTPATLGRASGCGLRLRSAAVSREHARIVWDLNAFAVVDLNSSNGTRVNGVDVSEARLEPDDALGLGDVVLRFAPEYVPLGLEGLPLHP